MASRLGPTIPAMHHSEKIVTVHIRTLHVARLQGGTWTHERALRSRRLSFLSH
jgi:hypothetical protein